MQDAKGCRKYKSILFYMTLGHFYLITDKDAVNSISHAFQIGHHISTTLLKHEENTQYKDYVYYHDIVKKPIIELSSLNDDKDELDYEILEYIPDPKNTIVLIHTPQNNLMKFLPKYVELYNSIPNGINFEKVSVMREFKMQNGLFLSLDQTKLINKNYVIQLCNFINVPYQNQSVGVVSLTA
jgi:hypothetical protein